MGVKGVLLGLGLALPGVATAARPLAYEDAVRAAVAGNPTLVASRLALEQASDDVRGARGTYDPVLQLTGGWQRQQQVFAFGGTPSLSRNSGWNAGTNLSFTSPTGTTATVSGTLGYGTNDFKSLGGGGFFTGSYTAWSPNVHVQVGQNLLRGLLPSVNLQAVRQARDRHSIAELQAEVTRQQAVADVAKAYWSWADAVRLAEIAHRSVATAQEAFRVGEAQVAEGRLAPVERTRLEAALVQSQGAAIEADHTAEAAADALLVLMGEVPGQELEPVSVVGEVPELDLDGAAIVDTALASSPSLALVRRQAEAARLNLRDARFNLWPSLSVNVDASYGGSVPTGDYITKLSQGLPTPLSSSDFMVPSVSLGGIFSLPLGNRAAVGVVRRAEAEVAKQAATVAQAEAELRSSVLRQVRVLESAALKVRLGDVNLRLARETLAAEEAMAAVGRSVTRNVLEARTKLEQAEGEAVRARSDFRRAEVELRRLQGTLGDAG